MADKLTPPTVRRWRKPKQARSLERVGRILDVAEAMFVETGYEAATTKQIAAQAEVAIGSLYQFFPDKAAILEALAERYTDLLGQRLQAFGEESTPGSLAEYVDQMIDVVNQFYRDYPGYRAVFLEITASMPDVDKAANAQLIRVTLANLSKLSDTLTEADYEAIGVVLVEAIGQLLWFAWGQSPNLSERLVKETKLLALSYLKNYLPANLA
ncbi:MAG: TetR/AcrR family transcriptional regulator [Cyanobacteria bacterium P01_A01_bin.105]